MNRTVPFLKHLLKHSYSYKHVMLSDHVLFYCFSYFDSFKVFCVSVIETRLAHVFCMSWVFYNCYWWWWWRYL